MKKLGFDKRWIELVMTSIRFVTYFVLINGQPYIGSHHLEVLGNEILCFLIYLFYVLNAFIFSSKWSVRGKL
jgi:hypothetical protein